MAETAAPAASAPEAPATNEVGDATSNEGGEISATHSAKETKAEKAMRELGEGDLDALVQVKINGETKKITLRQALREHQLEQASRQKMNEATMKERQVSNFVEYLKSHPKEALKHFGLNPQQLGEAWVADYLEEQALSPEQKRIRELETYQETKQREEKEAKDKEEQEKRQIAENSAREKLDIEFTQAFTEAGLPKNPTIAQIMALEMVRGEKHGEPLQPKEAAAKVKSKLSEALKSTLSNMEPLALLEFLGDELIKKFRDADMKKATGKLTPPSTAIPRTGDSATSDKITNLKARKQLDEKGFREWLRNR